MVIKGQPHFHGEASHDVLDEGLGEGDAVEVLHVVELLNDFQVGLEVLDLGSKILGNFLRSKIWLTLRWKVSMLPNSSISLALKRFNLLMLLRDPLLFSGIAWSVKTSLTGLSHLVRENPLRTDDSQG